MNASVVGVHGVRQHRYHRNPDALADQWAAALAESAHVPRTDFALAYYSDVLHLATAQGGVNDLTPEERDLIVGWLIDVGVPQPVAQGPATARIRDGIDWLIRTGRARGASRAVVAGMFREVATYLSPEHSIRRDKARLVVADAVRAHRPRVVVAHSLGSVVAYETFWRWETLSVELLVTVGSPLAMPHVFYHRLDPPSALGHRRPPGVRRWVNICDVGDLIAVPKNLADFYDDVEQLPEFSIDAFEFHAITPYLCHPVTGAVISGYLDVGGGP